MKMKGCEVMKKVMKEMVAVCLILCSLILGVKEIYAAIPDKIYLNSETDNVSDKLNYGSVITVSDTIEASSDGSFTLECSLLNLIPIKEIQVHEAETKQLAVSGDNVGIYLEYDGLLVIDTQNIENSEGEFVSPAEGVLKKGDYIKSIDGQILEDKEALVAYMETNQGETVTLSIQRDKETMDISLQPVCTKDGTYKLGIWVRDDTQGIGTLTYIDENNGFGALGHSISDTDSGALLEIKEGALYTADIISIKKGQAGNPGELSGVIIYKESEKLGTIQENTECGIFGDISAEGKDELGIEWCEVAYKEDIQLGKAQIRCSTGDESQLYDIKIEEVTMNSSEINKNFIFKVTDEALLEKTGGIVQGLSGSPILQDGKIIGAVTHVLVNDPTRGYGIFIENMLEAAS